MDAATPETYKITRPGKGSFNNVLKNMEFLQEYKKENNLVIPYTRASMVITKNNQNEHIKFFEKFSDLVDGIEIQAFTTFYNMNSDIIPTNANKVDDFSCSIPWYEAVIRKNGDVHPCCTYYGFEMPMGNINKTSIYDIYNSQEYRKIRQDVKTKKYSKQPCASCSNSFYQVDVTDLR